MPDVQPIDQGAILASGRAVVPDYMAEQIRQQLANAQTQQAQAQMLSAQTAHATQQREAAQLAAYQAAVTSMGPNPTLQQHLQLMRMFPGEYSAAAGRAWEAQDKDTRDTDFSQMAQVHDALRNGHPELAGRILQTRHDADAAAGHPDPVTEQMLAAINSGDPTQIAQAQEMARRTAAIMAGPEHFKDVYGADEPHVESIAPAHVALQTNAPGGPRVLGQSPIPAVHAAPNGAFVSQGPTPGVAILGGGTPGAAPIAPVGAPGTPAPTGRQDGGAFDFSNRPTRPPASSIPAPVADARSIVQQLVPEARITDWRRDPNSALGRANPDSWHNRSGAAVDVAPVPGMTYQQYLQRITGAGYQIIEARDEATHPLPHTTGPNWHVVIGHPPVQAGGPVRVRTAQQYANLPRGREYIDPTGVHRIKN
jgi:hypothetical protein